MSRARRSEAAKGYCQLLVVMLCHMYALGFWEAVFLFISTESEWMDVGKEVDAIEPSFFSSNQIWGAAEVSFFLFVDLLFSVCIDRSSTCFTHVLAASCVLGMFCS